MSETETNVGVVTGEQAPELTEDGRALLAELRDRGMSAGPVRWTDSQAEWSQFDVVLLRSCWEYYTRPDAFRDWLQSLETLDITVLNPGEVIRWNLHKFYLRELAADGVSILPTAWIERGRDVDLASVLRSKGWEDAVVKPAVGTSSANVWRTSVSEASTQQQRFEGLVSENDVLLQEFAEAVTEGERSLVFFGGTFSHATLTVPGSDDFRAHPSFGGTLESYEPDRETIEAAGEVLQAACRRVDCNPSDLPYARVDCIERDGSFRLMELELIEPYLGLGTAAEAVGRFADAIELSLGDAEVATSSGASGGERPLD